MGARPRPRTRLGALIGRAVYALFAFCATKSGVRAEEMPTPAQDLATPVEDQSQSKWRLPERLRLGPFDFQPRLTVGMTYDDNILISSHNTESDAIWSMQPAILAVAGDRLAIGEFRRAHGEVVGFSAHSFITSDSEDWPGKTPLLPCSR